MTVPACGRASTAMPLPAHGVVVEWSWSTVMRRRHRSSPARDHCNPHMSCWALLWWLGLLTRGGLWAATLWPTLACRGGVSDSFGQFSQSTALLLRPLSMCRSSMYPQVSRFKVVLQGLEAYRKLCGECINEMYGRRPALHCGKPTGRFKNSHFRNLTRPFGTSSRRAQLCGALQSNQRPRNADYPR